MYFSLRVGFRGKKKNVREKHERVDENARELSVEQPHTIVRREDGRETFVNLTETNILFRDKNSTQILRSNKASRGQLFLEGIRSITLRNEKSDF